MLYKSLLNIIIAILSFVAISTAFAASSPTTPADMTCKEFLDLNPKSMTPVAFWVINKDTQFKKGDAVDFQEIDTVYTPKIMDMCKKSPDKKVAAMSDMRKEMEEATNKKSM
ncbi:acid-activated periplasmic chaperone HdeB [Yersinia mollaretii]|uniref:Acid stress chaperone HdeB n=1 Tax=Yersinia mollaretii TaxID=33060 RepID=A0AA44CIM9_YERMO|nr:acid-activated periplasmic chaperone HdeB [Yersinia mollaretii]CNK72383.1 acid-resistance protein [Yersinia enterocolitica]NIL21430.1 acid-activated periplasmic chaperone HdeB [Yersinia mollaretii]CNI83787.1 acid-resistance protein [Yersinia mollaretii]CNJ94566.1 acid-resistance protein [Yersinia mollaretii]CQR07246.1 acid-resistance protein [Yersinia mollaretii]